MSALDHRREVIHRGRAAEDLLNNETLSYCMDEIMHGLFGDFIGTGMEEAHVRERTWAVGQAMGLIKKRLEAYRDAGRIEQENKRIDDES